MGSFQLSALKRHPNHKLSFHAQSSQLKKTEMTTAAIVCLAEMCGCC